MKRRYGYSIYFLCLLYTYLTAGAAVTVDTTRYAAAETGGDVLAIPRAQMGLFTTNKWFFYYNQWRGHWYTQNVDSTTRWIDEILTEGNGDHAHVNMTGDTILLAAEVANSGLITYRIIKNPINNTLMVLDSNAQFDVGAADPRTRLVYRGDMLPLPNSDTMMLITRGHDGYNALDISFWTSTNGGVNWDSAGYVRNYSGNSLNRVGSFAWDNTISTITDTNGTNTLSWFNFNRGTGQFNFWGNPLIGNSTTSRGFCFNHTFKWKEEYAFAAQVVDYVDRDSSIIRFAFNHSDSSANGWVRDSLVASIYSGGTLGLPYIALTYIEATNRLTLSYIAHNNIRYYIGARYWQWQDSSWSQEYVVENDVNFANKFVTHMNTPVAHGDVMYIRSVHTANNYIIKIQFDADNLHIVRPSDFPFTLTSGNQGAGVDSVLIVEGGNTSASGIIIQVDSTYVNGFLPLVPFNADTVPYPPTIGFNTANGSTRYGLHVDANYCTIENFAAKEAINWPLDISSPPTNYTERTHGIFIDGVHDTYMYNVHGWARGAMNNSAGNSYAGHQGILIGGSGAYRNRLIRCSGRNDSQGYVDRQDYVATGIVCTGNSGTDTLNNFSVYMDTCWVPNASHAGALLHDGGVFVVKNSVFRNSLRNDHPNYIGFQYADGYALVTRQINHGVFRNNVITRNPANGGGGGFFADDWGATSSGVSVASISNATPRIVTLSVKPNPLPADGQWVRIYGASPADLNTWWEMTEIDTITFLLNGSTASGVWNGAGTIGRAVQLPYDTSYFTNNACTASVGTGWGQASAFRTRYLVKDLYARNNIFVGITGNNSWDATRHVQGVWIGNGHDWRYPINMRFENNQVLSYGVDAPIGTDGHVKSITLELLSQGIAPDIPVQFRNNYIASEQVPIQFGSTNSGTDDILFIGDTVAFIGSGTNRRTFYFGYGTSVRPTTDAIARNLYYLNGTGYTDEAHASGVNPQDFTIERTLNLFVHDGLGGLVSNAACSVWNEYGTLAAVGTSNASGLFTADLSIYWHGTTSDSAGYSPWTVTAKKDGDVAENLNFLVAYNIGGPRDTTFILGEGPPPVEYRKIMIRRN